MCIYGYTYIYIYVYIYKYIYIYIFIYMYIIMKDSSLCCFLHARSSSIVSFMTTPCCR